MDFETFKRAVDSMEGFPGLVALIGGEPTLHPEFERFMEYLQTRYPRQDGQKSWNLSSYSLQEMSTVSCKEL